jgi:large subunit ribosomal protein L4
MQIKVKNLKAEDVGTLELADDVFGLEARTDILARVIDWQLAKRRSGNHKTKGISEISGTTKKPYRQKGTGRARQGSLRSPQFRGGARIFGPVVRDHGYDLNKKIRKLGLKTALSVKQTEGKLIVLDNLGQATKTKELAATFAKLGWTSVLLIDGPAIDDGVRRAAANLKGVDVLPQVGANVYDIMRRDTLVLTKAAVEQLEARLK